MTAAPVPVRYAGVFHLPSAEFCLVRAIHRLGGVVVGYDLWNDYAKVELAAAPPSEVDLWRDEVPGVTYVWRDLAPGMAMMWIDGTQVLASEPQPDHLDVVGIRRPATDDGLWTIDAVQGRYAIDLARTAPQSATSIWCSRRPKRWSAVLTGPYARGRR